MASDELPIAQTVAARQAQDDEAIYQQLLAGSAGRPAASESASPLSAAQPQRPPADAAAPASAPSAIAAGARTTLETAGTGAGKFLTGLNNFLFSGAPRAEDIGKGFTAEVASGLVNKVSAAKDVFDGLMQILVSPGAGAGAALEQALKNLSPAAAQTTLFPGGPGGLAPLVRAAAGATPFDPQLSPAERQRLFAPMTVGEAVNLATTLAVTAKLPATARALHGQPKPGGVPSSPVATEETGALRNARAASEATAESAALPPLKGAQTPFDTPEVIAVRTEQSAVPFGEPPRLIDVSPNTESTIRGGTGPGDRGARGGAGADQGSGGLPGDRGPAGVDAIQPDPGGAEAPARVVPPAASAGGENRINLTRIAAPDPVQAIIAELSGANTARLAPHRAVLPNAETIRRSQAALPLERALALDPETATLGPVEMTALRDHLNRAATLVDDLATRTRAGEPEASSQLVAAFTVAGELALRDEAIARNVARGLQSRTIASEAGRQSFTAAQLAEFAGRVGALPEMDPALLAERLATLTTSQRTGYGRQVLGGLATGQDLAFEAWINMLLSNPQTHAANTLGNTLTTVLAIPERALATAIGRVQTAFGGEAGVQPGEPAALIRGAVEGFADGLRLAGRALRSEESGFGLEKVEHPPAITAARLGLEPTTAVGGAIDFLGTAIRVPGRFLKTEDAFFKAVNYRMELKAQAVREAQLEGLEGRALSERVQVIENHAEQFPAIKAAAEQEALIRTFNNALGPTGQAVQRVVDAIPGGRLVAPFVRTPTNIAIYVGQRTPVLNLLSRQMREDFLAGGARRDLALAKAGMGLMTAATVTYLVGAGHITGGGPKDKNLQRDLRAQGWQPYAIRVGDTFYSYNRLDPLGGMLGIIADAADMLGQVPDEDTTTITMVLGLALSKNLISKTYLQGVANVLEAIEQPDRNAKTVALGFARSLIPAVLGQVQRTLDPTVREARTVIDAMRARIPGLADDMPARRNPITGEPIYYPPGLGPDLISPVAMTQRRDDPVLREITDNRVSIPDIPDHVAGRRRPDVRLGPERMTEGLPLTPEERDRLTTIITQEVQGPGGRTLHQELTRLVASPEYQRQSDGPDGGRADVIRRTVRIYREAGIDQLRRESPILDDLLRQRLEQRLQQRAPAPTPIGPNLTISGGTP